MLVVISTKNCDCGVFSTIRDLLQWNVAGTPTFHRSVDWEFDPEVSQKRRELFYDVCNITMLTQTVKISN